MKKKNGSDGVVYSTNPDFRFPKTGVPENSTPAPAQQQLKVFVDRKNRGGKTVTCISGFTGTESDLEKLGRELKSRCGVGGTVKEGEILIQGDHRDRILEILIQKGYRAKKSGG